MCLHSKCIKILSRSSLEGVLLNTGTRMCLKCSFSEQILLPCKFMILPAADIKLAKKKNAHFHLIEISVWGVCFGKIDHIYLCLGGSSYWTHTTELTGWLFIHSGTCLDSRLCPWTSFLSFSVHNRALKTPLRLLMMLLMMQVLIILPHFNTWCILLCFVMILKPVYLLLARYSTVYLTIS